MASLDQEGGRGATILLRLVRHGESLHNISSVAAYGDQGADPSLYDAPLSPRGEAQASDLASRDPDLVATASLVIVSPLTRALQTLIGAAPPAVLAAATVEVWPVATEHLTDSCDIGSSPSALAARFSSSTSSLSTSSGARLDFSALPPVWWYVDEDTSKTDPDDSRVRFRDFGFHEPLAAAEARVDSFVAALAPS